MTLFSPVYLLILETLDRTAHIMAISLDKMWIFLQGKTEFVDLLSVKPKCHMSMLCACLKIMYLLVFIEWCKGKRGRLGRFRIITNISVALVTAWAGALCVCSAVFIWLSFEFIAVPTGDPCQ